MRSASVSAGAGEAVVAAAAAGAKRVDGSAALSVVARVGDAWKVECMSALSASSVNAREAPAMTSGGGGGTRLLIVSE